jgi:UTP:GlnB (protein PII) uridylyltransferase
VEFLALALSEPSADAAPVSLTHYMLDCAPDQGSALYLDVRGPDRVGFLAGLLTTLEEVRLTPRDMTIMTRDGETFDRFWLKTVEGRVPSDEDRRALARRLDAVLVRG